jgi:hypothetical protein
VRLASKVVCAFALRGTKACGMADSNAGTALTQLCHATGPDGTAHGPAHRHPKPVPVGRAFTFALGSPHSATNSPPHTVSHAFPVSRAYRRPVRGPSLSS